MVKGSNLVSPFFIITKERRRLGAAGGGLEFKSSYINLQANHTNIRMIIKATWVFTANSGRH